jgi:hypothetical protein
MFKKFTLGFTFLFACAYMLHAITIDEYEIYGVRPADKISSLEINPAITVLDDSGGVSSSALTLKYYYVFSDRYSMGIELPGVRYESPDESKTGLGDVLLSVSMANHLGAVNYGIGLDTVIPTATDDVLGGDKLQLNPSAFLEFSFSPTIFFATGYKHYQSVTKKHSQEHTSMGRIRNMLGYTSQSNWWAVLDAQYYVDYENSGVNDFILGTEFGVMVDDEVSIYIKPSWRTGGNMNSKDWSLDFGVKLLSI